MTADELPPQPAPVWADPDDPGARNGHRHAEPGQTCRQCNDPAARLIAAYPYCVEHFAAVIDHCLHATRRHLLTPTTRHPIGSTEWAELLRHGITIGVIDDNEAAHAWNTARDFAA